MWVVTGGAGYIGSHVVRALLGRGITPIVVDDLSTGRLSTLPRGVDHIVASVHDTQALTDLLRFVDAQGVIHLAAKKAPSESVVDPLRYYQENVGGVLSVLNAMRASGTSRIVLSSSCSVYGMTDNEALTEDTPLRPVSPYGRTKVISEWLVEDTSRAHGFSYVNLRYFNVAGNAAPELADPSAINLVPMALRALSRGEAPQIFGDQYPTPDGTCIRDYVHVADVADAHAVAAHALMAGPVQQTFNVGTGRGSSVREVMTTVSNVTRHATAPIVAEPRQGDPACAVGNVDRIRDELGWQSRHSLTDMVASAWDAMRTESGAESESEADAA